MLKEEALIPNKIKFKLGPYCPICTPTGYRCMCNDKESDWDGTVVTYHPVPQAQIQESWFQPQPETVRMTPQGTAKMTPHGESAPNSPRSERTQTTSEYMELHCIKDLDQIPDYLSRPYNDYRKPQCLRRQNFVIWKPPQGWPKCRNDTMFHTPVHSPEYIPSDLLTPNPKPSSLREVIWEKTRVNPQGELPHRPDSMYIDSMDKHLYDKLRKEEEKMTIKEGMDGLYETLKDKKPLPKND